MVLLKDLSLFDYLAYQSYEATQSLITRLPSASAFQNPMNILLILLHVYLVSGRPDP